MSVDGKRYTAANIGQPIGYELRPGKKPKRLSESVRDGALRHVSVRAGIIVTGTEVLSGLIRDANGPWLSEQLRALGVELSHIVVVGDRPDDLRRALDFLSRTSTWWSPAAGSGRPRTISRPTSSAAWAGATMELDAALEERIWAIVDAAARAHAAARRTPMRAGARKQAHVPVGAVVLEPVGTAPGFLVGVVAAGRGPAGAAARAADDVGATRCDVAPLRGAAGARRGRWSSGSCASSRCPSRRSRRRCASSTPTRCRWRSRPACGAGSSSSRRSSRPSAAAAYAAFEAALRERHGDVLFSDDGATIDEVVARLLAGRTIATAESCTGGLMAGRLTDLRRLVGVRARRARRLLQRGQDGAGGRVPRR